MIFDATEDNLITCVCQVSLAVRNPFEVVKQRAQAYSDMNSLQALRYTLVQEVQLQTGTSKPLVPEEIYNSHGREFL